MIDLAKVIYLNTPSRFLRDIYYKFFCAVVRKKIVVLSIDGINYKLDLGEVIDLGIYLNRYEPDMVAVIQEFCRPGFTVLDIGANVGAHTLRLLRTVGDKGKVYAFEPTDYAYNKLIGNISLNRYKNITPVKMVLSDKNALRQKINFRSSWPTKGKPLEQESEVDFIRLDDWCERENILNVDLIKLDVDGNEYNVIKGAGSMLTKWHPLILMEAWGPNFSDESRNPFILLKNYGYRFYNTNTRDEYINIDDLKSAVSFEGKMLDFSFNIVAKF
jgi:FkbM family methyltransferase